LIFSAISITSIEFFLFCAVVTAVYFLLPPRVRVYWLLVASYIFYAVWNILYVPLLLASTLFNYLCARRISTAEDRHKDRWLILAIIVNVGVLIAFKYIGEVSRAVANWAFATGFVHAA
jgi:D-alanyl-lipoteichoic acid acyltransferase DltB (MBOAT superfamily)